MSGRRNRVTFKVWRALEASAEGPLGILGMIIAVLILAAGAGLGWW